MVRKPIFVAVTLLIVIVVFTGSVFASKPYPAPHSMTQKASFPDIYSFQGANVKKGMANLIISPETSKWDAYISYGTAQPETQIRLCKYWKITNIPIHEFELRSHFNNALIEPRVPVLMSFSYDENDLRILPFLSFPEESLKVVETNDRGESWRMLRNSVVDTENNTVSAISNLNNGYMVVAGFVNPKVFCNYSPVNVKGAYVPQEPESIMHVDQVLASVRFKVLLTLEFARYKIVEIFQK